ncbi:MAG: recombination protein RecR [Elusimicrobia bacterium HGW-Elusimicrobia-1]|jgi:recombination protein RecR|nr:MAG: recombination protein RecR [Elusimicrobia bacterium HGW-Elusimicrobia-1]
MRKPRAIDRLAKEFEKIPGIGPRQAERIVYFFIKQGPDFIDGFASAASDVKNLVRCSECRSVSETSPCAVCSDTSRDSSKLLVVANTADAEAIERTGKYDGYYFAMGALLSPLDGINPADLPLNELKALVEKKRFAEVIIATDPNVKGDATALLIADALDGVCGAVTRLAYGLPFGGDVEYADEITLSGAIDGRRNINKRSNQGKVADGVKQ